MAANSPADGIWYMWEPLVEVKEGCNGYPMIGRAGDHWDVAQAWDGFSKNCDQRRDWQGYSRAWVAPSGETAILYGYWSPSLYSRTGHLRYFVQWVRISSKDDQYLSGCSGWGYSKDLAKWRWQHWRKSECEAYSLPDGTAQNGKRVKIVLGNNEVWPGNVRGVRSHLSTLLMWRYMPKTALDRLHHMAWPDAPNERIIFEDDQWDPRMQDLYRERTAFLQST